MNKNRNSPHRKEPTLEQIKANKLELDKAVEEIYKAVKTATNLADKHGMDFSLRIAYGMGGYYCPFPDGQSEYAENGWSASSQSC